MFLKKTMMTAGIIVLVFTCIIGISAGIRGYSPMGIGAIPLVAPVQKVVSHFIYDVKDIWNHYFYLVSTAKQNDELKKELGIALDEKNQCKETALANIRLRYMLDFRKKRGKRYW